MKTPFYESAEERAQSYLETRRMPRGFHSQVLAMLAASLTAFQSASVAYGAVCTNPAVASMRPTGDGRVEIVVKNAGAAPSPSARLRLTYIDQDGKETNGPVLTIAGIKPHGSILLHAPWPSYADAIHSNMFCSIPPTR